MKYLLLSSLLWLAGCGITQPSTLYKNHQGIKALQNEKVPEALNEFNEVLQEEPFRPEVHMNLGITQEILKDSEKALSFYSSAEKFAQDDQMKFMSYFNKAQLYGKLKKYDEALNFYQKALEIIPSSMEVKKNIELLIQAQQQDQKKQDQENKDKDKKDEGKDGDTDKKKDQDDQGDNKDDKSKDSEDQKDKDQEKDKDKQKEDEKKEYGKNPKPQPRKFDGKELSEGDVKKILGELKQQEQKIRANFNRKKVKEQPRDKDW